MCPRDTGINILILCTLHIYNHIRRAYVYYNNTLYDVFMNIFDKFQLTFVFPPPLPPSNRHIYIRHTYSFSMHPPIHTRVFPRKDIHICIIFVCVWKYKCTCVYTYRIECGKTAHWPSRKCPSEFINTDSRFLLSPYPEKPCVIQKFSTVIRHGIQPFCQKTIKKKKWKWKKK